MTKTQFLKYIESQKKKHGGTEGLARHLKMNAPYLVNILKERRPVNPKMLATLGFEKVEVYRRIK